MRLLGYPARRRRRRERGQALAEFSLVILPFMTMVIAIIEFSFLLTVKVGITDTAQDAAQLASEVGTSSDSDFQVLQIVEKDMSAPVDRTKILSVEIFSTDSYGVVNLAEDKYTRGGSYVDPLDNSKTVPYSSVSTTYPPASRCNTVAVAVCGGVDYIGVIITYQYTWMTPLPNLVGLGASGPKFVQTSVSRMEPLQ
jgi:Flp pilus assembly protein TadG